MARSAGQWNWKVFLDILQTVAWRSVTLNVIWNAVAVVRRVSLVYISSPHPISFNVLLYVVNVSVSFKSTTLTLLTYLSILGSILGPILFSIYINDLPICLLQSKILLYADDAVLFYADSNIGNISIVLNKDLKQFLSWTQLNKLCIHHVKTEYVLFGTQQRIASATLSDGPFSLFLGNKPISTTAW